MALAARALPAPEPEPIRAVPQNVEAEQALLGAILVNNEAFYRVSDFLEPVHFHQPVHRDIYEVARMRVVEVIIDVRYFALPIF